MAEDGAPRSLAERIAALNLAHTANGIPSKPPPTYEQATSAATLPLVGRKRPPPPTPPRPALPSRTQTSNVPTTNHVTNNGIGNQPEGGAPAVQISRPPLPARTSTQSTQSSQGPSPNLPPRRPSDQPSLPLRRTSATPSLPVEYDRSRRGSDASVSSVATTRTSLSGISESTSYTSASDRYKVRAPEYDPSALPALPPKRSKEERDADARKYAGLRPLRQTKSTQKVQSVSEGTTPPPPARQLVVLPTRSSMLPPPLPSRQEDGRPEEADQAIQAASVPPTRQSMVPPPPLRPRKSPLEMGFGQGSLPSSIAPLARSVSVPPVLDLAGPPPIPSGSKPDLAVLQASKPKFNGASNGASGTLAPPNTSRCLHCRDFSGPDGHAARFPRESLPHQDVAWLAQQLTSPFSSITDKARAIFTWLHHNVAYDTYSFFNNCVKPSTPQQVLQSGLAVCEGYAGLFNAMAVKAGLECIVLGGACKGFGHKALGPGEPLPPYKSTHAWNAVRIDDGEWKLIDACWGAGHLDGNINNQYKKEFSPERFTQSNDTFGLDHFPEDSTKQFRNDGRIVTYEEFILGNKHGCGAHFFSGFVAEEGMISSSFQPAAGKIMLAQQGPTVRFAFQKVCPHWNPVTNGKGAYYVYILHLDSADGAADNLAFDTNGDVWWCDVRTQDLIRGGKVHVWAVNSFEGRDGRGVTVDEYNRKKGRVAMGFGGVCTWEIV